MATSLTAPQVIAQPFAASGDKTTLPETTATAGSASLSAGIPPECSLPIGSGGSYIKRTDLNGLGNLATSLNFYMQNGGQFTFSDSVALAIGGYPAGAILRYTDGSGNVSFLQSMKNSNSDNFITTPAFIDGVSWAVAIPSKAYVDAANRFFYTIPAQGLGNVGTTWTTLITSGSQVFENKLTFIEFKASFSGAYSKTIYFQLLVDGVAVDTDYWQSAYGDGATYSYSPRLFFGTILSAGSHIITVQFKGNGLSASGPIHLATF